MNQWLQILVIGYNGFKNDGLDIEIATSVIIKYNLPIVY